VNFEISVAAGTENQALTQPSFTLQKFSVHNVAKRTSVELADGAATASTDHVTTGKEEICSNNTFTFYIPESRYNPKANENGKIDLAGIYGGSNATVIDPMCGSGTLLIESALKALQIPPGINRKFSAQNWGLFDASVWQEERGLGIEKVRKDCTFRGIGSDIDPNAVYISKENAKKAGILSRLSITTADAKDLILPDTDTRKIILCNPPYGERLMELQEAEKIYKMMGETFKKFEDCDIAIISPHEHFESLYGKKADKRRKLYNGMIKCQLYMYKKR
jgi:putative N6-adenine-specific DNA methylase